MQWCSNCCMWGTYKLVQMKSIYSIPFKKLGSCSRIKYAFSSFTCILYLAVILPGLWRHCLSQQLETGPWSVWQTGSWLHIDWGWGSGRWAHHSAPSASGSPEIQNTGREVEERGIGGERDKYLDHTRVSGVMTLFKKKNGRYSSLTQPIWRNTAHPAANTAMRIYFGNTYRM